MLFILALIIAVVVGAITAPNVPHPNGFIRLLGGIAAGIVAFWLTYLIAAHI